MRVRLLRSRPVGSCALVAISVKRTQEDPAKVKPSYSQMVDDSYASQALAKLGS